MMTRTAHFERYSLVLTPLSPIHIGSGDTIEPYEYSIDRKPGFGILSVYNLTTILSRLDDRQRDEFNRINQRADLGRLRGWIRDQANAEQDVRFKLALSDQCVNDIEQHLDNPRRCGEIQLMTRDARSGCCYIPGSSLKGALRTAVIDAACQEPATASRLRNEFRGGLGRVRGPEFESAVMGNRNSYGKTDQYSDPFRQLAVSDLPMLAGGTYIDRIQIVKRGNITDSDPRKIVIYREVTRSLVLGEELECQGEIRLMTSLASARTKGQPVLPCRFDWSQIRDACNDYYQPRLRDELQRHVTNETVQNRLSGAADNLAGNECLVRLGHHSHFECVTFSEPFRVPPRRGFGASRSYVDGKLPLGWAKLRVTPVHTS